MTDFPIEIQNALATIKAGLGSDDMENLLRHVKGFLSARLVSSEDKANVKDFLKRQFEVMLWDLRRHMTAEELDVVDGKTEEVPKCATHCHCLDCREEKDICNVCVKCNEDFIPTNVFDAMCDECVCANKECSQDVDEKTEDVPKRGAPTEWFCDWVDSDDEETHENEPILHDGDGGYFCERCDEECDESSDDSDSDSDSDNDNGVECKRCKTTWCEEDEHYEKRLLWNSNTEEGLEICRGCVGKEGEEGV
jgi:hypothetical protein